MGNADSWASPSKPLRGIRILDPNGREAQTREMRFVDPNSRKIYIGTAQAREMQHSGRSVLRKRWRIHAANFGRETSAEIASDRLLHPPFDENLRPRVLLIDSFITLVMKNVGWNRCG